MTLLSEVPTDKSGASCFPPMPPNNTRLFFGLTQRPEVLLTKRGTYSCSNLVATQADSLLPKEYIFLVTRLLFLSLQGYSTHLASLDYPIVRIVVSKVYTAESSLTTATSLHFSLYLKSYYTTNPARNSSRH